MARFAVSCNFTAGVPVGAGSAPDIANALSMPTDQTAFETALATLVSDGVSPTQAHVTAANSAYTTLKADFAGGNLSTVAKNAVVLSVDAAVITTRSKLRQAVLALLQVVDGGVGGLTS